MEKEAERRALEADANSASLEELEAAEAVLDRAGVRYPKVEVQLTGHNGNAFNVIGRVGLALRRAGVPKAEIDEFRREATSGDYDHVLATAMRWVEVLVLAFVFFVGACSSPSAPEPIEDDVKIDWPVREWRDSVAYAPEV